MTTVSIPLTNELNEYVEEQVRLGNAASKAELIRRALVRFKEEEFIATIRRAQQEVRQGKALTGNLDELARGFE